MITPTISYGGTTIDLGYPDRDGNRRELDERAIVRRTLEGNLRTTILSLSYRYQLSFSGTLRSTYDALVALWRAASAAGAYPTLPSPTSGRSPAPSRSGSTSGRWSGTSQARTPGRSS